MSSIAKSNLFKFTVLTAAFSAIIAGFIYFYPLAQPYYIVDFQESRDMQPIVKMFDKDWYWLVAEATKDEYSPEFMLKHKTMSKNPLDFGKLTIKVLREKDKTAGFTAYCKKSFYKGFILYVAVDRVFRGKGYGEKLTRYAMKDLFNMGVGVIELLTRTTNEKARALYEKLGFTVDRIEDRYVYYSLKKK